MANNQPCAVDDDCGIARICIPANTSWAEESFDYCECNPWFGWTGDDCLDYGRTTVVISFQGVIQVMIIVTFLFLLSRAGFRLVAAYGRDIKATAANYALITLWLSFFCFAVWRILFLAGALTPTANDRFLQGDETSSTNSFTSVARPFIVATQVFTFVSAMTISVVWVEVANASSKMHMRLVTNASQYRKIVWGIEGTFALAMFSVAAAGRFDFSGVIAAPFLILLMVLFGVGRWRMAKLLKQTLTQSATNSRENGMSGDNDMMRRTRRALNAINRTALHAMIAAFLIIVFSAAYTFCNEVPAAGWIEFMEPGKFGVTIFFSTNSVWSILYLNVVVALYTLRTIKKVTKKALGTPGSSTNFNGGSSMQVTMSKDFTANDTKFQSTNSIAEQEPGSFASRGSAIMEDDIDEYV